MVIQSEGHFDPVLSDVEQAGQMLQTMEGILADRRGLKLADVRPSIAHSLRTTVGTLVNIKKQRRKTIPHSLMAAFRRQLIIVLQSEIMRLENEILIHKQIAGSHRSDDLALAETQVFEAKKTLRLAAQ
jgi:hypothetical protein